MEPKTQGETPQDPIEARNQWVQADLILDDGDINGNKCIPSYDNSDSDKDYAKVDVGNRLALFSSVPSQGE